MLIKLNTYSGVIAKIKAMKRNLLTNEDYEQLLSKNSVNEIAGYLKHNTGYGKVLTDISEDTIHRGQLEKILRRSSEQGFERLAHFLKNKDKEFLKIYILDHEIELLKQLLSMTLISGSTVSDLYVNPYFLKNFSINPHKLAEASTIQEFAQELKNTKYYILLSQFLEDEKAFDLFKIEMVLDAYFYKTMWRLAQENLIKSDKKIVLTSIGSDIDMLNIMWILRSKKYFDIPREIVYSFVLPVNYKLKQPQIIEMVESKTYEQAQDVLRDTEYNDLVNDKNVYFEQTYKDMSNAILHKLAKVNNFSMIQIIYFLRLKDTEIENLIRIIEGVRYNVDKNEIRKYLVHMGGENYGS